MTARLTLALLLHSAVTASAFAQDAPVFPRGAEAAVVNHTGTVWLGEVSEADEHFNFSVATAAFAPAARLNWHTHPGGQILMITEGIGYFQERGQPVQTVRKGDVIRCAPGSEHWHGATPTSAFAYVGITMNHVKGRTIWLQKLTDDEYARASSTMRSVTP